MFDKGNDIENEQYNKEMLSLKKKYEKEQQGILKKIKKIIRQYILTKRSERAKLNKTYKNIKENSKWKIVPNYVTSSKIAVYTSVFGNYDSIYNPIIMPDNCDFFIITDVDLPPDCKWQKIDIEKFEEIKGLSNIEKNRYFKMQPHKVFSDYDYSIYVDGNVEIRLDLSNMLSRIGDVGIAIHRHSSRYCVYDEAEVIKMLKKDSEKNIDEYLEKIKRNNMPNGYGLLECNVLVREHNNDKCRKIMEEWWQEFKENSCNRDQMMLPYVLFKNNIPVSGVDSLGKNVFKNVAFVIHSHGR